MRRITFPAQAAPDDIGMLKRGWWLTLAIAALAFFGTAVAAWSILPIWQPDWVIAHVRFGDPLVRALVARHGPTHDAFARHGWSAFPLGDGVWPTRLPDQLRGAPKSACLTACRLHAKAPSPGHRLVATWIILHLSGERPDQRLIDRLLDSLEHDGLVGRTSSLVHLAALGVPRALPLALTLLQSPDPELRRAAATALGLWGDPDARRPFVSQQPVRWSETPGRIGAPTAVEPLINALADPDRQVRILAFRALAAIGDARAAPALFAALGDSIPIDRQLRELLLAWKDPLLVAGVTARAIADDLLVIARWGGPR